MKLNHFLHFCVLFCNSLILWVLHFAFFNKNFNILLNIVLTLIFISNHKHLWNDLSIINYWYAFCCVFLIKTEKKICTACCTDAKTPSPTVLSSPFQPSYNYFTLMTRNIILYLAFPNIYFLLSPDRQSTISLISLRLSSNYLTLNPSQIDFFSHWSHSASISNN